MKKIEKLGLVVVLMGLGLFANAQNTPQGVSIAPTQVPPSDNAMLDVVASEKGILVPRVTKSVLEAPSGALAPANIIDGVEHGLLVFVTDNTDDYGYWYFDDIDNVWKQLGEGIWKVDAGDDIYYDHDDMLITDGQAILFSEPNPWASGRISFTNASFPSEYLSIDYHAWDDLLHFQGGLMVDGDLIVYGVFSSSDSTLKTDVNTITGAVDKVELLRGVSFRFKTPTGSTPDECGPSTYLEHYQSGTQYGVVAQEVEAVFPELVKTGSDGKKIVNYQGLIAPLIEATKEQQQTIEAQDTRIETLETTVSSQAETISTLQSELDALEERVSALER